MLFAEASLFAGDISIDTEAVADFKLRIVSLDLLIAFEGLVILLLLVIDVGFL